MKKALIITGILGTLGIVGLLAYRVGQPPEGVRVYGDIARVTSYAMLDENAPAGSYVMLDSIPPASLRWLAERGFEHTGFEPHTRLGYGDTLNHRHPYFVGFSLYAKRE
jgi:hypothetical protein